MLLFYLLWIKGLLTINSKRAILYIGKRANNYSGAKVGCCTGYVKRIIKFKHKGTYQFNLDLMCESEDISATLQDRHKKDIAVFNRSTTQKSLDIIGGKIYYLKFIYIKASGSAKFYWQ